MIKQHRKVNEILKVEIVDMHGLQVSLGPTQGTRGLIDYIVVEDECIVLKERNRIRIFRQISIQARERISEVCDC